MDQSWGAGQRFLSVDPVVQSPSDPQTVNGYGYVRNNPVNLVDPDGRWVVLQGFHLGLGLPALSLPGVDFRYVWNTTKELSDQRLGRGAYRPGRNADAGGKSGSAPARGASGDGGGPEAEADPAGELLAVDIDSDFMTQGQVHKLQTALRMLGVIDPSLFEGKGEVTLGIAPLTKTWAETSASGEFVWLSADLFELGIGDFASVLGHELKHVGDIQFRGLAPIYFSQWLKLELRGYAWEMQFGSSTGVSAGMLGHAQAEHRALFRLTR